MKSIFSLVLVFAFGLWAHAVCPKPEVRFCDAFADSTLYLDVSFMVHRVHRGGGHDAQSSPEVKRSASIDTVCMTPRWWGRRVNLDHKLRPENLEVVVADSLTGDTLYHHTKYFSFSPGPSPVRGFVQVPMPRRPAVVRVSMTSYGPAPVDTLVACYTLSARDIASMPLSQGIDSPDYEMLRVADSPDRAVTIAIVADGFTQQEMPLFIHYAQQLDSALMAQPVFARHAPLFNIAAIKSISVESGVSRPSKDIKVNTALGAHFDSYSLDRLVTIPQDNRLGHIICGRPADHVIILANSDIYGGSGACNDYCISTVEHDWWLPVVIHEFGHSFGRLGDEYEGGVSEEFLSDEDTRFEPLEPNITNLKDFSHKWLHLIFDGKASLIEGANYHSSGYWRGSEHCLMRAVADMDFCPVCSEAITSIIQYHTLPGR